MKYLFSGKASVKHLTTTEDIGSPRLLEEQEKISTYYFKNIYHISKVLSQRVKVHLSC